MTARSSPRKLLDFVEPFHWHARATLLHNLQERIQDIVLSLQFAMVRAAAAKGQSSQMLSTQETSTTHRSLLTTGSVRAARPAVSVRFSASAKAAVGLLKQIALRANPTWNLVWICCALPTSKNMFLCPFASIKVRSALAFLFSPYFLHLTAWCKLLDSATHGLPFRSLDNFEKWLHKWQGSHLLSPTFVVSMGASQRQLNPLLIEPQLQENLS